MVDIKKTEDVSLLLKQALEIVENSRNIAITKEYYPFEQIQKRVKEERKKQKVTRAMLAKLAGVSVGTVNSIELGKLTVSILNVQKVLNVLGKKLWIG
jgi:DNA-binding XRE family transcriptional regulator